MMFHRVSFRLAFFAITGKDSFFASLPDVYVLCGVFNDRWFFVVLRHPC